MPPLHFLIANANATGVSPVALLGPPYYPSAPYTFLAIDTDAAYGSQDGETWVTLFSGVDLAFSNADPYNALAYNGVQAGAGSADASNIIFAHSVDALGSPVFGHWDQTGEVPSPFVGSPPALPVNPGSPYTAWDMMNALTYNPVHDRWVAGWGDGNVDSDGNQTGEQEVAWLDGSIELPGYGQWNFANFRDDTIGQGKQMLSVATNTDPDSVNYGLMVGGNRSDRWGTSNDGGETWTSVSGPNSAVLKHVAYHRYGDVFYATGTGTGQGIYQANGGGTGWTLVQSLGSSEDPYMIATNPNTSTFVVATEFSPSPTLRRGTWTDVGTSTSQISLPGSATSPVFAVAYSPSQDRWIASASDNFWYSDDDAQTWTELGSNPFGGNTAVYMIAMK